MLINCCIEIADTNYCSGCMKKLFAQITYKLMWARTNKIECHYAILISRLKPAKDNLSRTLQTKISHEKQP